MKTKKVISQCATEETTTVIAKQMAKEQGSHWELRLHDAYQLMMNNQDEYNKRLVKAGYSVE